MQAQFHRKDLGYTLVELLVVMLLLGLMAAMTAPNLFATSQRAKQEKLVAELIDLDTRARVLSGRHDMCLIRFSENQSQIQLVVVNEDLMVIQRVQIPDYATAEFNRAIDTIEFDRLGRSKDYGYQILFDELSIKVRFNGLSGWHETTKGQMQ
tara:strand:+ start:9140 stop:9598 length:459 start_codon:yes stop_codon:yes gene_type:complete